MIPKIIWIHRPMKTIKPRIEWADTLKYPISIISFFFLFSKTKWKERREKKDIQLIITANPVITKDDPRNWKETWSWNQNLKNSLYLKAKIIPVPKKNIQAIIIKVPWT